MVPSGAGNAEPLFRELRVAGVGGGTGGGMCLQVLPERIPTEASKNRALNGESVAGTRV